MATDASRRFALTMARDQSAPYGAWWPRSRDLGVELADLFAHWPPTSGRIARVLYSPPDWDDHPRSVATPGRRVKTGSFPKDDTHQLVLTMLDGRRLAIAVIAPNTPGERAEWLLDEAAGPGKTPAARHVHAGREPDESCSTWDNEGGHGSGR